MLEKSNQVFNFLLYLTNRRITHTISTGHSLYLQILDRETILKTRRISLLAFLLNGA